jgi:hypothetical protein
MDNGLFAEDEGLGLEGRRRVVEEAERGWAQEKANERRRVAEVRPNNMMHAAHNPPTSSFVWERPQSY